MPIATEIWDNLPIAVVLFDANGRLVNANLAACTLLKLNCQADQGRMHHEVLPDLTLANCAPCPEGDHPNMSPKPLGDFASGRIVLTHRGQKLFCRTVYLPAASAGPAHIILLVEDMADPHNLAGRVLEEERLMGVMEISNTMAHKLNQYLQVIMGYVSLMTLEMEPDHDCYAYLNKILEQLENIRQTTHLLSNIHRYAVIERPDGRRMFDLDNAALDVPALPLPNSSREES